MSMWPVRIVPLTPDRWADFERLFGPRGACGGCWCMWWRVERSRWRAGSGEGNRRAFRRLVGSGDPPGLLAYVGTEAAGWMALAPRDAYLGLARSRILKPLDDRPVWSITCFYVSRPHRGRGLTVRLLQAAADFVRKRGGSMLEGYPNEPRKGKAPDPWVYTGLATAFRRAGFVEVARPSPTRPIMRRAVRAGGRGNAPRKGSPRRPARRKPGRAER